MIRTANLADLEPIRSIWNALIKETSVTFNSVQKTPDEVAAFIQDGPHPVFVAETNRVVGYATYGPFRNGIGYERIAEHSIVLTESAQGIGLGRKLMDAVISDAKSKGINSLIAGISAENAAGQGFHERLGFVEVGRIPHAGFKFDRYIDLVLMQKRL